MRGIMDNNQGDSNGELSAERAVKQFRAIIEMMKANARERMKTPQGRESLRRDIAGLQGVPVSMVKFEGED